MASKQSITVDYLVAGQLDGITAAPVVELGVTATDPDSQIYAPGEAPDLGVIDPDLEVGGSIGPRCITQLLVDIADGSAAAGAAVTVEAEVGDEYLPLFKVGDITAGGLAILTPFIVPQGAVLRLTGVQAGSEPVLVRVTTDTPEDPCLIATLLAAAGDGDGDGDGDCPCLTYDEEIADQGQEYELNVGKIRLYDASALQPGDMTLLFPAMAEDNQQVAIKEIGNSTVPVTCDGNGPPIELPTSPPVFPGGSVTTPRGFWLWQYDQANDVWRLR